MNYGAVLPPSVMVILILIFCYNWIWLPAKLSFWISQIVFHNTKIQSVGWRLGGGVGGSLEDEDHVGGQKELFSRLGSGDTPSKTPAWLWLYFKQNQVTLHPPPKSSIIQLLHFLLKISPPPSLLDIKGFLRSAKLQFSRFGNSASPRPTHNNHNLVSRWFRNSQFCLWLLSF